MSVRLRVALALLLLVAALLIGVCLDPTHTPASRIYYHGSVSGHFDGRRFFNPDGDSGTGGARTRSPFAFLWIGAGGSIEKKAPWPASVPVEPSVPPRRVEGDTMRVTWIGHATTLVQTHGLNILFDPVWAERDSPVQWAGPRRVRAPGVRLADLPPIDLVLISHNHYDHLDLDTLDFLWRRDHPLIVTGLGNDTLLAQHHIRAVARDWGDTVPVRPRIAVTLTRAHHWSARWIDDIDRSLWCGFRVTLPGGDIYYSGDTGTGDMRWGPQAKALSPAPIRLALLPIAPYHVTGRQTGNHIDPAQAVTAFAQLGAAYALGVHWGTFDLGTEAIDDPPRRLARALAAAHIAPGRFRTLAAGEGWTIPELVPQR